MTELDIAIVGMSCRLPGASGLEPFWELLWEGRDAVAPLPERLLQSDIYYSEQRGLVGKTYSRMGGLIDPVVVPTSEYDECHEIFAEVAARACDHAGYPQDRRQGRNWAVYVGHSAGSSQSTHLTMATLAEQVAELLRDIPEYSSLPPEQRQQIRNEFIERVRGPRPRRAPDGSPFLAASWAARLASKRLQLSGPSAIVDAACASSLVALALGILSLRSGEVEAALVGGASQNKLESLLLFSQAQSCSATGSRPFDEAADGLISSEGYVALLLKRVHQAQADGDKIYAVITGLGLSADGRGKSLWAPNPAGQQAAMQRAYGGMVQPDQVQYVEAHATSTQVGDATEMESLNDFFRPHQSGQRLPIGSVKSNLGHTLETAGLASLLKVILSMQRGYIPPTLHVQQLNSSVDWQNSPFEVARQGRPWPALPNGSRCAAVSAFGIGGLNAHLVVEQLPRSGSEAASVPAQPLAIVGRGVVVAGAQTVGELEQLIRGRQCHLQSPPSDRWPCPPPSFRAGYVTHIRFDCVQHKVTPKAFRSGNPLQYMLLSATDQALREVDGTWQAEDSLVLVGTSFGGEFNDQLGLGLRFPELRLALQQSGAGPSLLEAFEAKFFQSYPALFDETGSFTSSTLASRLSKTYNLMGGALAIDAGEESSELALRLAHHMLSQGLCSSVVCAGGQRSLNLVGLEQLQAEGHSQRAAGEGAAVVVLKRLDQARQDHNPLRGLIRPQGTLAAGPAQLVDWVGHLQAGQGLLCLVASTLPATSGDALRWSAPDGKQLREWFCQAPESPNGWQEGHSRRLFIPQARPEQLELAQSREWDQAGRILLQEQGVYLGQASPRGRLAMVFSGQGSQYPDMLATWRDYSGAAQAALERADRVLQQMGLASFAEMVKGPALDEDPVVTQLAILIADQALYAALLEAGIRPHCVAGHSFGEIPALLAADVLTLEQALQLTKVRAEALLQASPEGGLLSIKAQRQQVEAELQALALPLYLTHFNAPQQTVVGGQRQHLQQLQSHLETRKIASRALKVPGALHTPLVQSAQAPLAQFLESLELRPPSVLFYSNVSCRPCLEVSEIRQNLLAQLVEPVDFMKLQGRLQADGVTALLEVGPGQVLTQLMRQFLSLEEVTLSYTDHPHRTPRESLQRVRSALTCAGLEVTPSLAQPCDSSAPARTGPILEHDATQARRSRRRAVAEVEVAASQPQNSAVSQFVLDYVVDLTGFAANVINRQWDLEADLGIDSIKRAQLFGELKSVFAFEASDSQLAALRTIEQIVAFVEGDQEATTQTAPPPSSSEFAVDPIHYERGRQVGLESGKLIWEKLRQAALLPAPPLGDKPLTPERRSYLEGVAAGAQIHPGSLLAYEQHWGALAVTREAVTERLEMTLLACPRAGGRLTPEWKGAALILGQNELAQALQKRLEQLGCPAHLLDPQLPREELFAELDRHFADRPAPHLFLATSHDLEAELAWDWCPKRRRAGLESPFWLCQRWLHQVKQAGLMDQASLVALTAMGGHLGLQGPPAIPEGGALAGLLKSISIESWVAGHRSLVVQVVDRGPSESAPDYVERVLLELANPSFDREIGFWEGQRVIPWARPQAAPAAVRELTGNWLCTGGARGITAYVAAQMASRFGLKLHLLGRAPRPNLDPQWLSLWPQQAQQLRLLVMEQARQQGLNSVRYWEATEKALEIQDTLDQLSQRGIEAHYYSCDLADEAALQQVLQEIRQHGPIEGILHGAGISRDAKFEHKEAFRVEECFHAKIDGTLALMRLTQSDPIRFFVGFGSISGRFGANGHADYSAANDMLAKLVGWYRSQRPEVCATTLHWHAWGDVGMAVRGETELGLKKIDMQFMPAREGLDHLLAELQSGAPVAEVLITNRRYHNQFFFYDRMPQIREGSPLLRGSQEVWLDPQKEVFLREHVLGGAPTLPLAVSLQILWEAGGQGAFRQVQAHHPLKYFDAKPRRLEVRQQEQRYLLTCEVVTRSGEVVERQRPLVSCCFAPDSSSPVLPFPEVEWTGNWTPMVYPTHSAGLVHGPSLQSLREWQVVDQQLLGKLLAPPLFELAGSWRNLEGWRVPSALLDGCFYAAAVLAWKLGEPGSLVPAAIEWLGLGELPIPGEICQVRVQVEKREGQNWSFSFELQGSAGQLLVRAQGFRMAALQLLSGVGN